MWDALFKTRSKPRVVNCVNVVIIQLRWISIFSKSSWFETTASGLSNKQGVNGEKKFIETGIL